MKKANAENVKFIVCWDMDDGCGPITQCYEGFDDLDEAIGYAGKKNGFVALTSESEPASPEFITNIMKLRGVLARLVQTYVKNMGTSSEFIACITPPPAGQLNPVQRRMNETWSLWDDARIVLGGTFVQSTQKEDTQ